MGLNVFPFRFTIYKVHKASKKKREKSSAKKERKATKTLAIVLGKLRQFQSTPSSSFFHFAFAFVSISIFALGSAQTKFVAVFVVESSTRGFMVAQFIGCAHRML